MISIRLTTAIDRTALGLLLTFLVVLPVLPATTLGSPHDLARTWQVVLLTLASASAAVQLFASGGNRSRWRLPGAAALGLAMLSTAQAVMPLVAAREVTLICGLVGLAWFVAHCTRAYGAQALATALVGCWALYAALFLILWALALFTTDKPSSWTLIFGFDNPRFLNHAQTIALPLLLGVTLRADMRAGCRRLSAFALVIGFLLLAVTFARATILALALAALLCAVLFGRLGLRFAAGLGLAAAAGLLAYEVLFEWLPARMGTPFNSVLLRTAAEATSDHSRGRLWHLALDQIAASPWLGIGPMHFAHTPNPTGAHPHNVYLQVAAEFGLPFLSLTLGAAGLALTRAALAIRRRLARQRGDHQDSLVLIGAFCACVAAAVDGGFSGNFVMPVSQVWIAVAAGLLAGSFAVQSSPVAAPSSHRLFARGIAVLLLASQLWLASLTVFEFVHLSTPTLGKTATAMETSADKWRPRFWRDGWF